jgi:MFS family permease
VSMFALNFQVTNALMASGAFHRGAREYGLLGSAQAVGCLIAAFLNARRERPRLRLVAGAALALGVTMTLGALMPAYLLYVIFLVPMGFCMITYLNSSNTSLQLATDPQLRGRVLAFYVTIQQGTTPLGAPLVGWLGSAFGARWSVLAGGFAAVVAGVGGAALLKRRPQLSRRFDAAVAPPVLDETPTEALR